MNSLECDFDLAGLEKYLCDQIEGFENISHIEKFKNGQSNPSYLLRTNLGKLVLRRQPFGELLKSAHAVDREYRVMSALRETAVPVPKAIHLAMDTDVIGSMFYVMSFEQGRIFWDPTLPNCTARERTEIYSEMSRVLAALHNLNVQQIGLADFGRPGDYYARQIDRWTRQYRASETETLNSMEILIKWLPENLPPESSDVSLIHGDFRIDNIIFDTDQSQALALLDWELSTLGHPYADLAYQCMQWRLPNDCVIPGLGDINRSKLGIPTEQEYVEMYCKGRNISEIQNWDFYLIFGFFRFAAILQGVKKRAVDGNASSDKAMEYGALTPLLADMALNILNGG